MHILFPSMSDPSFVSDFEQSLYLVLILPVAVSEIGCFMKPLHLFCCVPQTELLLYGKFPFLYCQDYGQDWQLCCMIGIFLVLFGLSIYVFRYRFTPGKLYIMATCAFFVLATVSTILDLALRCIFPLQLSLLGNLGITSIPTLSLIMESASKDLFLFTGWIIILYHYVLGTYWQLT